MSNNENLSDQDYIEYTSKEFVNTCSWFLMRKTVRVLTNYINSLLKETGILSTQLGTLAVLAVQEELNITELAKELVMDQTTATRNINQLQKDNLVKIAEGTDRRIRNVSLTNMGKKKLLQALPIWEVNQRNLTQQLGTENTKILEDLLSKTLNLLQKEMADKKE